MTFQNALLCFILIAPTWLPAKAEAARLGFGVSLLEVLDDADETAGKLSWEMEGIKAVWQLQPQISFMAKGDSEYFLSIGAVRTWPVSDNWALGAGLEGGYYHNSGHLDHELQFHSRLLADYRLHEKLNLRLEFGHISNNGYGDTNPGTELFTIGIMWKY